MFVALGSRSGARTVGVELRRLEHRARSMQHQQLPLLRRPGVTEFGARSLGNTALLRSRHRDRLLLTMQKGVAKKLASRIGAHLTLAFAPRAAGGADFVKAPCKRAGWHAWRAAVAQGVFWHVLLQTMPREESFGVEVAWTKVDRPPAIAPMGILGGGPVYATDATAATPPDQWLPLPRIFLRVEDEVRSMNPMWHLVRPGSLDELAHRIAELEFDPPAIAPALVDTFAHHVVRELASHGVGWLQRSTGARVAVRRLPDVGPIEAALLPHVVAKHSPEEAAARLAEIVSSARRAAGAAETLERSLRGEDRAATQDDDGGVAH